MGAHDLRLDLEDLSAQFGVVFCRVHDGLVDLARGNTGVTNRRIESSFLCNSLLGNCGNRGRNGCGDRSAGSDDSAKALEVLGHVYGPLSSR